MCLAILLELVEVSGNEAVGARDGVRRSIRVDFIPEPQVGDFVMVHAGFAIERLSREQAEKDLAAAREVEAALQEVYEAARKS